MNESVAKQETHGCLWRHDRVMGSRRACHVAILALTGLSWDHPALNWFLVCEMGGTTPNLQVRRREQECELPVSLVSPFSEQSPVWLPAALTQLTGSFCKFPPSQQARPSAPSSSSLPRCSSISFHDSHAPGSPVSSEAALVPPVGLPLSPQVVPFLLTGNLLNPAQPSPDHSCPAPTPGPPKFLSHKVGARALSPSLNSVASTSREHVTPSPGHHLQSLPSPYPSPPCLGHAGPCSCLNSLGPGGPAPSAWSPALSADADQAPSSPRGGLSPYWRPFLITLVESRSPFQPLLALLFAARTVTWYVFVSWLFTETVVTATPDAQRTGSAVCWVSDHSHCCQLSPPLH